MPIKVAHEPSAYSIADAARLGGLSEYQRYKEEIAERRKARKDRNDLEAMRLNYLRDKDREDRKLRIKEMEMRGQGRQQQQPEQARLTPSAQALEGPKATSKQSFEPVMEEAQLAEEGPGYYDEMDYEQRLAQASEERKGFAPAMTPEYKQMEKETEALYSPMQDQKMKEYERAKQRITESEYLNPREKEQALKELDYNVNQIKGRPKEPPPSAEQIIKESTFTDATGNVWVRNKDGEIKIAKEAPEEKTKEPTATEQLAVMKAERDYIIDLMKAGMSAEEAKKAGEDAYAGMKVRVGLKMPEKAPGEGQPSPEQLDVKGFEKLPDEEKKKLFDELRALKKQYDEAVGLKDKTEAMAIKKKMQDLVDAARKEPVKRNWFSELIVRGTS